MKNPLTLLFGKRAVGPALPPPDPAKGLLAQALAGFAVARFGGACATLPFATISGDVESLSGRRGPDEKWSIRKITDTKNIGGTAVPVGEAVRKTRTLHEGLSFFDAVKILSEYERGQIALGALPLEDAPPGGSARYHEYYVAFAEREGIVFDTSGAPHPTLNGDVVTDGSFAKAALDRARAVHQKHSAYNLQGGNDFVGALLAPAHDTSDHFAALIGNSRKESSLIEITRTLRNAEQVMDAVFFSNALLFLGADLLTASDEWVHSKVKELSSGDEYYDWEISPADRSLIDILCKIRTHIKPGETVPKTVERLLNDAARQVPSLSLPAEEAQGLKNGIEAIGLYFTLNSLRIRAWLGTNTVEEEAARRKALDEVEREALQFKERFKNLGGAEDGLWKICSFLLEKAEHNNGAGTKPQAIHRFLAGLDLAVQRIGEEGKKLRKLGVAGPYTPF